MTGPSAAAIGPTGTGASLARPPVLVLRALGLGDTLTGVPALRGLRRAFPGRRLLLAAAGEPAELLRACGVVDAVVPTRGLDGPPPGAGLGPHIAVNLHGRGPQSHRLLAAAGPRRIVAYACPEAGVDGPRWNEAEHEVRRWTRLVDAAASRRGVPGACHPDDLRLHVPGDPPTVGRQRYAVLHPGASSGARRWPARRWARVAAALERRGVPVVLTGGPDERALVAGVAATARAAPLPLHRRRALPAGARAAGGGGVTARLRRHRGRAPRDGPGHPVGAALRPGPALPLGTVGRSRTAHRALARRRAG